MAKKIDKIDSGLIAQQMTARVRLHNYRYPANAATHTSGTFAIIMCDVLEVTEGTIPNEARSANGTIALKGKLPQFKPDIDYIVTARLEINQRYGAGYLCDRVAMERHLDDPAAQRAFLGSFMSEARVKALYETLDDPIAALRSGNIAALCKVRGIGESVARNLCEKYAANADNDYAYGMLLQYGLTTGAIDKIVHTLGSPDMAVDIVTRNPYALIRLVPGYGWAKADAIALAQGYTRGCRERCLAFALYLLDSSARNEGSSRMNIDDLLTAIVRECDPTPRADIAAWVREVTISDREFNERYSEGTLQQGLDAPIFVYTSTVRCIGLVTLRRLECRIRDELQRLKNAPMDAPFDPELCEKIVQRCEERQGYKYTYEQRKAIKMILSSNVSVLTGSSGCGKSSTLTPLIHIFSQYNKSVAQCALSGRAASLLTEYTGLEGKTIHRLLGYQADLECFSHNAQNPLPMDVVIVDETSMVGEELFLSLISAMRSGTRLVLLGDVQQLPPLAVGNILGDCIKSGYIPTTTLTTIHRQALRSGIISEAAKVCAGVALVRNDFSGAEVRGELQDFRIVCAADAPVVHMKALEEYKRLLKEKHLSADDIQIIVPTRAKGVNSCRMFNEEIQEIVNPPAPNKPQITTTVNDGTTFEVTFREGDRILITKNNYHAQTPGGGETAVFNGNLGHIERVYSDRLLLKMYDGETVIYGRGEWNQISLAYAITCHKCQGSQAPYVIVGLDNGSHPLLIREWLYTAITRAQKYCVLVGQPSAINTATRNSDRHVKNTWLLDDLYGLYRASVGLA